MHILGEIGDTQEIQRIISGHKVVLIGNLISVDDKYFAHIDDIEFSKEYRDDKLDKLDKKNVFKNLVMEEAFTISVYFWCSDVHCEINVGNDAFKIFSLDLFIK